MDDLVTWLTAQLDDDERIAGDGVHTAFCVNDVRYPEECQCGWSARLLREAEAKRLRIDYLAGLEHDMGPEDFVTFDSCRILAKPGELGDLDVGYCSCGLNARRERLYRIEALPYAGNGGYRDEWRP